MTNLTFTYVSFNPFGLTDIGDYTAPTLADINGDGDLDIFIGAEDGNIYYQENTGTRTVPTFTTAVSNPFGLDNMGLSSAPTFVDIDGDNDLDAFVGSDDGDIYFFANTGTRTVPTFTNAISNPFGFTNVGFVTRPTFVDIDGDNDLDAFVGNQNGNIYFFANTGTTTVPNFTSPVFNPFGLTTNNIVTSSPTFADIDGDNDFDAFVGAENGNIYYFKNTGTRTVPSFATRVTNPLGLTGVGASSSPTFADINGDGDLDAFVGTQEGNISYFENNTSPTITGAIANQAVNDNAIINPFSNVTIGSIDGDNLNVTIGLDNPAKGTLSTVSLSLSGTSASVTADLRALTFNPTDNRVAPGQTETSSFTLTVTVSDRPNSPVTDTITTVISTSINDAPVVNNPIPNPSVAANTSFTYTFPADTFRDADVGQTLSYRATGLPNGVTFDANTRTFSGTPATGSNITVTASDGIASVSDTFELLINIQGDSRANTLVGTNGNDILTGLQGRDILTGGTGTDIFRYMSMVDAGDTITDFEVGTDKLDFSNLMRSIGYGGSNNPLVDQYVRLVARGNNVTIQIDPDGTGPTVSSNYIFTIRNVTAAQMDDVNNFIF